MEIQRGICHQDWAKRKEKPENFAQAGQKTLSRVQYITRADFKLTYGEKNGKLAFLGVVG